MKRGQKNIGARKDVRDNESIWKSEVKNNRIALTTGNGSRRGCGIGGGLRSGERASSNHLRLKMMERPKVTRAWRCGADPADAATDAATDAASDANYAATDATVSGEKIRSTSTSALGWERKYLDLDETFAAIFISIPGSVYWSVGPSVGPSVSSSRKEKTIFSITSVFLEAY